MTRLALFLCFIFVAGCTATGSRNAGTGENVPGYKRPFGNNAPWNIPVKNIRIHPESDKYADLFWNGASREPGNVQLSFEWYTYPVYYTCDATGYYYCRTRWNTNINGKEIPFNPQWLPAYGTDGQIIILDSINGYEWDLWQVKFERDTVFVTNGNLIQAGITAGDGSDPGDYRTKENGFIPSRGVGIPYLAMLVRPGSVEQGVIDHALSNPIRNTCGKVFVPPATKLEHPRRPPGIPEGMRFALKMSDEELDEWVDGLRSRGLPENTVRSARIIARALIDYGWFITDTSGGCHLQFEDRYSAGDRWEQLGLSDIEVDGRSYPRNLLRGLFTRDRIYTLVPSDQY
jgi:hypothetical protein